MRYLADRFQQMINLRLAALAACLWFSLSSCGGGADDPDIDPASIQLSTRRFDRDLVALDTNQLSSGLQSLRQKYPDFLEFYLDTLMGFRVQGNFSDNAAGVREGLRTFLTYPDYRGLFDSVAAHFPEEAPAKAELQKGFAYYKHYFPQRPIPKIVYLTTGLNSWNAFTVGEDLLGIGLDMYLGRQYPFYASVGIPAYAVEKFTPAYMPVDVMRTLHRNYYPFEPDAQPLLSMILQRGKEQYFLKKVLPFTHDSVRLGFTSAQTKWCNENEAGIYNALASEDLLYETNLQKVMRYVNDGPTSAGFPPEAPGNIGTFLGLRIVEAWMDKHDNITVQALLNQQHDAQRFLQESGYKPR